MFGGPWLGIAVFVLVAVGLGWGVHWFFKQARLADTTNTTGTQQTRAMQAFDPDSVYLLKQDLLLGYTANGLPTLFPARDELPAHAYGRRSVPTIQQARAMTPDQLKQRDLKGVVVPGTPVRFVELIDDPDNAQTRILLQAVILQGPHAHPRPVLGMHLESADTDEATGAKRYAPREDLFTPVQSPTEDQ